MKKRVHICFIWLLTACLMLSMPKLALTAMADDPLPTAEELVSFPEEVGILINEFREENGLAPVQLAPVLLDAASVRAQELTTFYSHSRPDGRDWFTIVEETSLDTNCYAAENIAAGFDTPEGVVEGWINSPSHCAALLGENYQYIGVGISTLADDPNYYYTYWQLLLISAEIPPEGAWTPGEVAVHPEDDTQQEEEQIEVPNVDIINSNYAVGDCNLDNSLSMADVVILQQVLLKQVIPTDQQLVQMNCYQDGVVDQKDATILMQHLLGVLPAIPVQG